MIKIQRDFLWGVKEDARGMYWVAWEKVCRDKKEGGLGIKNLETFNIALLSKWKWRFLVDENACWRDILKHRYGELGAFMLDGVERSKKGDSLWWRDIYDIGEAEFGVAWFKGCVRRGLGGGEGVNFWRHHWLGHQPLCFVFPNLFAGCTNRNLSVAEAGCWTDGVWQWTYFNNVVGSHLEIQEADFLTAILREISPVRDAKDSWKWFINQDKLFSVKSTYSFLSSSRPAAALSAQATARLSALWNSAVPSKIKVFGWRILSSALPSQMSLLCRNVLHDIEEAACVFCENDFEDQDHLLVRCDFAKRVWAKVENWLGLDPIIAETVLEHFDYFAHLFSGKKAKKSRYIIWLATCWSIWLARNNCIFKGEDPVLDSIVCHIKSTSWSWFVYGVGSHSGYGFDSWWCNAFHCIKHL